MTQFPHRSVSTMANSDPPRDPPDLLAAAVGELEACDKRTEAFGKMMVGQEAWRLLLAIYVDQSRSESSYMRSSDFTNLQRRWLKVLALEGMLEAGAANTLRLSDHAVRCLEHSLIR